MSQADSLVGSACKALGAATLREQQKITKYKALALAEEADFLPFVVESTGALGF